MADKNDIARLSRLGIREVAWLMSSAISALMFGSVIYFYVHFMAANYERDHPQFSGDDDLAFGVKIVFWILGLTALLTPLCVAVSVFLGKKLIKRLDMEY